MRTFRSIPSATAELIEIPSEDGLVLNLYRLAGGHDRPAVLFGHACGFAAGSYLPLLARLTAVADVFAFDARGHGGSDAPSGDLSIYSPSHYARDLARIAQAVAERKDGAAMFYVGHSLGAAAVLRLGSFHTAEFGRIPWRALLLFEPPIFPPPEHPYYAESQAEDRQLVERTRNRRAHWPSAAAFAAALAGRGVFKHVGAEFLRAHAAAGLRPDAKGSGYDLCCPPAVEARTFQAFNEPSAFDALSRFPAGLPLHLIGGDAAGPRRSWVTLMAPEIAARLGCGSASRRFTALPGRGHLMVQEDPEMTQRLVHNLISSF